MAIDPISAGLGVASLIGGKGAQKKAESAQAKAQKGQQAIIDRATKLFDALFGTAQTADQSGQFDPQKAIDQLGADTKYAEGIATGNDAAAARSLGYRPGDTIPLQQIQSTSNDYKLKYADAAQNIRRQSFLDKLNAYVTAGGAIGGLNTAANLYGQQYANATANMPNPTSLYTNLMPFLPNKPKASVNTGTSSTGTQDYSGLWLK